MKKTLLSTLLLLSLSGFSSAATFDGPLLQVGTGFANLTSDVFYYFSANDIEQDTYGHFGILGKIEAGYSHSISQHLNIAANIFYHFGTQQAGHFTDPTIFSDSFEFGTLKNIWGITIEPGYYLAHETLAYLKFGLANGSAAGGINTGVNHIFDYGVSTGPLYGFGMKQKLSHHFFAGLETYHINFFNTHITADQSLSSLNRPALTYGGILIGYLF